MNGNDGPQGYLIPQDARLGEVSTYLPMQTVEAALTQLTCRHCLIILDCCFSGAFRWSSSRKLMPVSEVIHKERYHRFIQDPAWQVITSASHDQLACDALDLKKNNRGIDRTHTQHSPFATALMDALKGEADTYPVSKNGLPPGDGVITATELYLYLRDIVEVATNAQNMRQTPGLWSLAKHDKGEYIFLTPGHVLNLPSAPELDESEASNPYRGLKAYEKEHSATFFGRTSLIEKLCDFVCDRPFTVVLGASGSGKSSLVKAGLVPHLEKSETQQQKRHRRLEQDDSSHQPKYQIWQTLPIVRPGETPLIALAKALNESQPSSSSVLDASALELRTLVKSLKGWSEHHPTSRLLLIIDQAEELITQCLDEQEREQFLRLIAGLAKECSEFLHVLLTLRSDFEPQLSEHETLKPVWISSRFIVPTMTRNELREIIEAPASSKVVYFETNETRGSLVEQLVSEVADMPGALPLLSFALSELYLELARRFHQASKNDEITDRLITWQDYDELGGVPRSVTKRADDEYKALTKENSGYEQTIRRVMLRMVSIDGGSTTKRKVPFSELEYPDAEGDRVKRVIEVFVDRARLLISSKETAGISYVEPAHDALIVGWERLRDWIQKEGENLAIQRQLTYAAGYWQHRKHHSRYLWHNNPRLSLFDKTKSTFCSLNRLEQNFVQHSISKRRWNTFGTGFALVSTILILLGGAVFWRSSNINRMRDLQGSAESRLLQEQNLEALIEGIKAAKVLNSWWAKWFPPEDSVQNEVQATLQHAVSQIRERNRITTSQEITNIAFSPNGQIIATANADNSINFWDTEGKLLTEFNTPNVGSIQAISFTPNSAYLVAKVFSENSSQPVVKRWNIQGELKIQEAKDPSSLSFNATEDTILSENGNGYMAISSDGTLTAKAEGNFLSIFRHNSSNEEIQQLTKVDVANFFNINLPLNVRFSPDSKRIATAGYGDRNIYLWDLGGNQLARFQHEGGIRDLKFSPDGEQLATVGMNGIVRIWQNLEGSQIQEFRGYAEQSSIESIQLSSDRQRVATGFESGLVQVWDLDTQQQTTLPLSLGQKIVGLRFSPDDRFLALGASNGQSWIWNLETLLLTPDMGGPSLDGQGSLQKSYLGLAQWGASFSPDNYWLLLGGSDTIIHNIVQPEKQISLTNKDFVEGDIAIGWLQGFAFSKTDQILAVGGFDGTLQLWNWKQETKHAEEVTGIPIQHIAFSPVGDRVAIAGIDNGVALVQLWSVEKQQQTDDAQLATSFNNLMLQKQVELLGHTRAINAMVFNADGTQLATASSDGTARVWNLNGQQLAVFRGHDDVKHLEFSPDNQKLITAGFSSRVAAVNQENAPQLGEVWHIKTWNLQTLDELLAEGCTWIYGYLKNSHDLDTRPEFKGDRALCDELMTSSATQIPRSQLINLTPVTTSSAGAEGSEPGL